MKGRDRLGDARSLFLPILAEAQEGWYRRAWPGKRHTGRSVVEKKRRKGEKDRGMSWERAVGWGMVAGG